MKKEPEGAYEFRWTEDGILGGQEVDGEHQTIYLFRVFERLSDSMKSKLVTSYKGYYDSKGNIVKI